ncbi:MAG: GerAB/ArcD/ProY family transporter [Clostridia bacterium]|nr:GerAB/ArcD/ProY family transporter [Clostridia bacterium]
MTKALKTRQICFFYIALLPVIKMFTVPSFLARICGEDAWLSALINSLTDILVVAILYFTLKDLPCDFFTALERRFGKGFSKAVICFYLVFFLLKTVMPMNEEKEYVELTLYMTSPNIFTFMPVFIAVIYLSSLKLRVIGRVADGVFFIAILGYLFMFVLALNSTDLTAILPVGAHGTDILKGAYQSASWFNDGAYFLFFTGEYVKGKKDGLKIILSCLLGGVIVSAFSIVFYGTFTSVAFRRGFALTEISKYTTAINNMERFDYLPIFALLFTSVFSLALPFYFATELLTRLLPVKRPLSAVITALPAVILLLFFNEYFASVETFITRYAPAYFIAFGSVFPIIFALILKLSKNKEYGYEIYES